MKPLEIFDLPIRYKPWRPGHLCWVIQGLAGPALAMADALLAAVPICGRPVAFGFGALMMGIAGFTIPPVAQKAKHA